MPVYKSNIENPLKPKEGLMRDAWDLIFGSNPVEEMQMSLGPSMMGLGRGAGMIAPKVAPPIKAIAPGLDTPEGAQIAKDTLMMSYDDLLKELGTPHRLKGQQMRLPHTQ